jgi:ribonucleoside-diphosphate reductase alpha chain
MDYIFRWLALKFLPGYESQEPTSLAENGGSEPASPSPERERGVVNLETAVTPSGSLTLVPSSPGSARPRDLPTPAYTSDAPTCSDCGSIMTRNGSCYKCENCGATSGCS